MINEVRPSDRLARLGKAVSRQSDFCSELGCSACKPRATYQVFSSHVWKMQIENTSISTGSSVGQRWSKGKAFTCFHGTNGKFYPLFSHILELLCQCKRSRESCAAFEYLPFSELQVVQSHFRSRLQDQENVLANCLKNAYFY